jgi:hypothetical protein
VNLNKHCDEREMSINHFSLLSEHQNETLAQTSMENHVLCLLHLINESRNEQCDESGMDTSNFHPLSENCNETSAQSSVEDYNSQFINDIQKQRAANERARSGIIIIATEGKYQKTADEKD